MEGSPEKPYESKPSLVAGRQPVIEALQTGRAIDKIILQANVSGESIGKIRQLARERHIPIQIVPLAKLNTYTRVAHQGCIALAAIVKYHDLQQVIDQVTEAGSIPLFLMLDGITDVRNIGGIVRTAVCCGAQAIVIPDKGVAPLSEDTLKSSAGALHKIQVCRVNSLLKAIDELRLNGIKVAVSGMEEEKKLHEVDFKLPVCIVIGSEDKGVQPYIRKGADEGFTIPMAGDFDSFNVSVATGIILYEAMKQRF